MRVLVVSKPLSELTGTGAIGTAPETRLGDIPTSRRRRRKFKHPGVIEAAMREAQYTKNRMDIANYHALKAASDIKSLERKGQKWTPRVAQWSKARKVASKKGSQAARVIAKLNRSKKEIDNGLGGEQGTQAGGVPSA